MTTHNTDKEGVEESHDVDAELLELYEAIEAFGPGDPE